MLKSFLDLQQRELDSLGEERGQLRERLSREELRGERLGGLYDELSRQRGPAHPLHWQNRHGLRQQVQNLMHHQQQQTNLARLDLAHHEQQLLRQFGKVKGLQQVVAQREAEAEASRQSREQKQLDELALQAFIRRRQAR